MNADEIARAAITAAFFRKGSTLRDFVRRDLCTALPDKTLLPWLLAPGLSPVNEAEWIARIEAEALLDACAHELRKAVREGRARLMGQGDEIIIVDHARLIFSWPEDIVLAPTTGQFWRGVWFAGLTAHGTVPALQERREACMREAMRHKQVVACFDNGRLRSYPELHAAFKAVFPSQDWGIDTRAFSNILKAKGGRKGVSFWRMPEHRELRPPTGGAHKRK